MLTKSVEEVGGNLDRVLAMVISRSEPIMIRSAWGSVVLLPEAFLDEWRPMVHELIQIADPLTAHVDAATRTSRWDSVTDLYDTDTGEWDVRTKESRYLFDLTHRRVSVHHEAARPTTALVEVIRVSVGSVVSWRSRHPMEAGLLRV